MTTATSGSAIEPPTIQQQAVSVWSKAWSRLCAGVLTLAATAMPTAAQRLPQRTLPAPIDFATSQNDNLFSLVRSEDDIHELEQALAELTAGQPEAAVRRLHELVRRDASGVVPIAPGRFLGLRLAVVTVLANLSPAARDAYEQLVRREAGILLARPLEQLSPRQLRNVADRFPTAERGLAARLHLGDTAMEQGDGLSAANHYRLALDATAIGSADERRIAERLACADALIEPAAARAARAEGRVQAAADSVLDVLPVLPDTCPAIGGGRSGATPRPEPVGRPTAFWREEVQAPGFDQRDKGELAMFPVGDLDGLFVNTGREVIAFDPLRRTIPWVSSSPMRDLDDETSRAQRGYENTINQDMVLAAAVGSDVVVAALQVPDNTINVDFQASFRIMSKIPQRRLFAFSQQSGKLLWSHFDEMDGPRTRRFRGHDSCAPPLIAGETVFAPVQDRSGAIAFSVAAYDLRTGQPRWRRLVCSSQQDVNMFGNARMEFAASPLALAEGVLYGSTNLGVTYAINCESGRIRWITAYDVVHMPRAMLHGQADRQVFFANNVPVVRDGVVCFTPLDSQFVIGQDIDSGDVIWRQSFDARIGGIENRVMWLAGAIDDEFILAGAGVIAVKARPEDGFGTTPTVRQLVRPDQIGDRRTVRQPARPAVTADHIWLPTRDRLLAFDRAGNARADAPGIAIDGYQPGNLLLVDGLVVSLRNRSFDVVLDAEALLLRSEQRVQAAPDDPAALLRLAGLRRALLRDTASTAESAAVQELFRRGLAACIRRGLPSSHPTRQALQRELFGQALTTATAAGRAGRPDALERFAAARDLAPDIEAWIEVQLEVLDRSRSDRVRYRQELDRLEQYAPTARLPAPLSLPVTVFALWQRALADEDEPRAAVARWQQLLERYGATEVESETMAAIAEAAIARLISAHGDGIYADVKRRADEALRAAGSEQEALEAVTSNFPNSQAAKRAGLLLLDRAVADGNLGIACGVLARAHRTASLTPGVLRRVQVAAQRRGNRALSAAMARALAAYPNEPSDWPEDAGRSFAAAAAAALAADTDTSPDVVVRPGVPTTNLDRIRPRQSQEHMKLLAMLEGDGFVRATDAPLYVFAGNELVAFDPETGGVLFAEPADYLDHVMLCGTTLVVPDMRRVFAVDYRTGELLWQLGFEQQRQLDSLGLTAGVLHVVAQPTLPDGSSDLLGIEPLTGTMLFTRRLDAGQLKPKPIERQLLLLSMAAGSVEIQRLDPVTGITVANVPCASAVGPGLLDLRPDSLATPLYPRSISGDLERLYLPIDGQNQNAEPAVICLDGDGKRVFLWRGSPGAQLLLCQLRGDHFVIVESSEQRSCRALLLDARTGAVENEVDLGHAAAVLNWESSWLDNRAPAIVAIEALVDRQTRQRQLVCFAVGDGPTFAVPLGIEDGPIVPSPVFGDGFVAFGVRPRQTGGPVRLYAIDLATRQGAFAGERKYRTVPSTGSPNGMMAAGAYTVLSTTQGLQLLGQPREPR